MCVAILECHASKGYISLYYDRQNMQYEEKYVFVRVNQLWHTKMWVFFSIKNTLNDGFSQKVRIKFVRNYIGTACTC